MRAPTDTLVKGNFRSGMYFFGLACVTIAIKIPVKNLTLCYSIWGADPNTVALFGNKMLVQVDALTLCWAIACRYGNVQKLRYYHSFFPLNAVA